MRATSVIAYTALVASGKVKGLKLTVYRIIAESDYPPTAGEVIRYYQEGCHGFGKTLMNSLSPRFAELERMGVIRPAGERPCQVTGQMAIVWEITGQPAQALSRKPGGKLALLREELEQCRKECAAKDLRIKELEAQTESWKDLATLAR